MSAGTTALRLVVGGIFVAHGLQKLTGAFGGPGLERTEKMMEASEMHPPAVNARLIALTETVGGAAIAAGAATPAAATGLIAAMTTAIRKVHARNGFFNSSGGYEFNLLLISALTAITADGPGLVSLDALLGKKKWGAGWALGSLAAGITASFAAVEVGRRGGLGAIIGANGTSTTSSTDAAGEPAGGDIA